MKFSEKPTDHILVSARCNSDWDNSDFAIIYGGKSWNEWLQPRLETAQKIQDYDDFYSLKFFDSSVEFYSSEDELDEKIQENFKVKSWIFVELENGEEEEFTKPENRLECHTISLSHNGTGKYIAYGKHTGEEFFTEDIPFAEILQLYADSDSNN